MSGESDYVPAALPDEMDWLMAPVLAGMCSYESLKDCKLDLCDIALMNDTLSIRHENEARATEAAKRNAS